MKRCSKCGNEKVESEFGKASPARDGLHWWCRACMKAYHAEAYANPNHPAHRYTCTLLRKRQSRR